MQQNFLVPPVYDETMFCMINSAPGTPYTMYNNSHLRKAGPTAAENRKGLKSEKTWLWSNPGFVSNNLINPISVSNSMALMITSNLRLQQMSIGLAPRRPRFDYSALTKPQREISKWVIRTLWAYSSVLIAILSTTVVYNMSSEALWYNKMHWGMD